MSDKPIAEQIRDSEAVQSLFKERDVATQLIELGWNANHGYFYDDPETRKLRELDLHAQQHFREQAGQRLITINALVEVKTMRGYHVVFAGDRSTDSEFCNRAWLGYHVPELLEAASRAGLSRENVADLSALVERAMAEEHGESPLDGLCVEPPQAPFVGAAFRETNIGTAKDLDASVIWRGAHVTFSAIESLKAKFVDWEITDIVRGAKMATYHPELSNLLRIALPGRMRRVEIFHPLVLTSAHLWRCEDDSVAEVPWVRWLRASTSGSAWCDIVTAGAAQDYFSMLTDHYLSHCAHSGLVSNNSAA
jgi:hypothetical protein